MTNPGKLPIEKHAQSSGSPVPVYKNYEKLQSSPHPQRTQSRFFNDAGGDAPVATNPGMDAATKNLINDFDEAWEKPTKEIRINTIVTTCSLVLALITLLNASTKSETSHLVLAALAVLMVGITSVYVTLQIYVNTDKSELFSICAPLVIAILSVVSFLCFYNW